MQPARRRPRVSSAAAANRGWLSTLRLNNGTPLPDEVLLIIFATLPDIKDLVRCAFTCRRWRRLVSAEAELICSTPRRPPGRFVGPLALGLLCHRQGRFVPTASALRRFPGFFHQQPPPSLSTAVDDHSKLAGCSHIVASRNGLLVLDQRHRNNYNYRDLRLCVCNPMTGAVNMLPPLEGEDGLGLYAYAVLTADDQETTDPPRPPSYFRLVIVYGRRGGFTAFRSYSSEDGRWSEEEMTDAYLGRYQLGLRHSGVVHRGGRLVYWLLDRYVLRLCLQTLQSVAVPLPWSRDGRRFKMKNTLLGMSPEGRLCAIQFSEDSLTTANPRVSICITTCTDDDRWWDTQEWIHVSMPDVRSMRLKWFCEKSGVVFFSAFSSNSELRRFEMYALSLKTRVVEKLVCRDRTYDPWRQQIYGYELDHAAYLASFAEP